MSSTLETLLRILDSSRRIFVISGVEVRLHITTIFLFLFFLRDTAALPGAAAWIAPAGLLLALYVLILAHEFGHALAARRFGIHTPYITLSPLGGLAHMQAAAPGPRAEILISLAGPLTHVLWGPLLYVLARIFPPESAETWTGAVAAMTVRQIAHMNLYLLAFNVLPFYPLDGGRVLRSALALRLHPNHATVIAARTGMVGAVAIGAFGLFGFAGTGVYSAVAIFLGISNYLACRREIIMARFGESPYGSVPAPWEVSGDEWKRAGAGIAPRRPSLLARLRERRRERARRRHAEDLVATDIEIDRLLEKVSQVGMGGLSRAERAALIRASERKRALAGEQKDRPYPR